MDDNSFTFIRIQQQQKIRLKQSFQIFIKRTLKINFSGLHLLQKVSMYVLSRKREVFRQGRKRTAEIVDKRVSSCVGSWAREQPKDVQRPVPVQSWAECWEAGSLHRALLRLLLSTPVLRHKTQTLDAFKGVLQQFHQVGLWAAENMFHKFL